MPARSLFLVGRGLAVAVVVSASAACLAGAVQAATGPAGAKSAFPPFDTTTFAGQLFWLALTFGALYWLMSTIALPRVAGILADRAATIGRDLNDAAQMQARAEATAKAYEDALAQARGNAQRIAQEARDAGAKASEQRRHAVESDLSAKLEQAEATITAMKTAAMENVAGLGSEAAIAIVAKLTGQAPSAGEADEAVERVLRRS